MTTKRARDWANDEADELLLYLAMCPSLDDERELVAAHLRKAHAAGAMAASDQIAKVLGGNTEPTEKS